MRTLKFRVFAKEFNKMCPLDLRDAIKDGLSDYAPEWPVMQFTGLLDKKGSEIYEGDIVQNLPTKKSVLAPKGWTGEIVYRNYKRNDGFYDCGFYLKCGNDIYLQIANNCEKIGNKYENPSLLK